MSWKPTAYEPNLPPCASLQQQGRNGTVTFPRNLRLGPLSGPTDSHLVGASRETCAVSTGHSLPCLQPS